MRILNSEIRLITPTDPEGKETDDSTRTQFQPGQKYYQLTHDYLVPSLRDWLTRKQKETRRGRAEILLADRATVYNARPENRQLPTLLQWLIVRLLTQKKNWTPPQRKMMQKATRYYRSGSPAPLSAGRSRLLMFHDNAIHHSLFQLCQTPAGKPRVSNSTPRSGATSSTAPDRISHGTQELLHIV